MAQRLALKRMSLQPEPGLFASRYPSLWSVLVPGNDRKGRPIAPAFIGLTVDGDSWRVTLSVPLGGMRTQTTIAEPTDLWDHLEAVLRGDIEAPWRTTKTVPPHLREG